jgi:hypothetical protein
MEYTAPYLKISGGEGSDHYVHETLPSQLKEVVHNLTEYPSFYTDFFADLARLQSSLSNTECSYAMSTVLALAIFEKDADIFSSIQDEFQRNLAISKATSLAAEPSLTQGQTPDQIKESILGRVQAVKDAYLFNEGDDTGKLAFFMKAFIGPPCFNGRLITANQHAALQKGVVIPWSDATQWDSEACVLENLIYDYQDATGNHEVTKAPFLEWLLRHEDSLRWQGHVEAKTFDPIFERALVIMRGGDL